MTSPATVTTQYKLTYFNSRGLAEVSRYLFALKGVDYEDYRFPEKPVFEANKESYPFGQVPVLQIGGEKGVVLAQSRAIERYLAKEFGFMGCSPIDAQLIDSVGEALRDLRDAYGKNREKPEDKAKFFAETFPKALHYLNRFANEHGNKTNTFVGNSVSLADVQLFQSLASFSIFRDDEFSEKIIADYPLLVSIRNNVAAQPQIQKWIEERPVTLY